MKCRCGAAFCWLCGKEIDDDMFPAHFQWWNPGGCPNMQMDEATNPPLRTRIIARLMAFGQLIVLGPITFASTLLSSLLCFPCIVYKINSDIRDSNGRKTFCSQLRTMLTGCMSTWGLIWLVLLIFVPAAVLCGSIAAGIVIGVCALIYPCYAVYR